MLYYFFFRWVVWEGLILCLVMKMNKKLGFLNKSWFSFFSISMCMSLFSVMLLAL